MGEVIPFQKFEDKRREKILANLKTEVQEVLDKLESRRMKIGKKFQAAIGDDSEKNNQEFIILGQKISALDDFMLKGDRLFESENVEAISQWLEEYQKKFEEKGSGVKEKTI